jgi:hypothetical protein
MPHFYVMVRLFIGLLLLLGVMMITPSASFACEDHGAPAIQTVSETTVASAVAKPLVMTAVAKPTQPAKPDCANGCCDAGCQNAKRCNGSCGHASVLGARLGLPGSVMRVAGVAPGAPTRIAQWRPNRLLRPPIPTA